jgi:hypothetical protein
MRKNMYPICIRAGIRLHRGQNTLPQDELPLVIHQSYIGKKINLLLCEKSYSLAEKLTEVPRLQELLVRYLSVLLRLGVV